MRYDAARPSSNLGRSRHLRWAPTVAVTRVRVSDVLEMLGGGASKDEILADFPYLALEDIHACLNFAAGQNDHPIVRADAAE
jgi:uncharacterized protein (DUF433 family)